jgi:hypothetical protein
MALLAMGRFLGGLREHVPDRLLSHRSRRSAMPDEESAGGSALTRAAALPLLIQIEQSFDVVIDACEIGKRELRREQELHSDPIDRFHL